MTQTAIFFLGAAGALAPEIVRLYNLRRAQEQPFSVFYILISILFAALGGVLAIILPATTLLGAFHAGVSAPILINTGLRQAARSRQGALKGAQGTPARRASLSHFVHAL